MKTGAIPDGLKRVDQWVTWVFVQRPGQAKPGKLPIDPATGRAARIDDPATWATFDAALTHARTMRGGVGVVLTPTCGFSAVDLDNAFQPDGSLRVWAQRIIDLLAPCYLELSPSRTGLHIFVRGVWPGGNKVFALGDGGRVEIYSSDRYLTVTGALWGDSLTDLGEDKSATLAGWRQRIDAHAAQQAKAATPMTPAPSAATPADDQKLWEVMFKSRAGWRIRRLYDGDLSAANGDASRADWTLAKDLLFWTGRDAARADRMFRQSRLYRPKWDARHSGDGLTYGQLTLLKAAEHCQAIGETTGGGRR
jgi:putative DNA primase/helicase